MSTELASLRTKVIRAFILIGVLGTLLVTFVLMLSLYLRDRETLVSQAREKAVLIRTGLLATMMSTGDPQAVRATVDSFRKHTDFDFRMVRSKYVAHQFGMRAGEDPRDRIEEDILNGKRREFSQLDGTTFRFVTPFITDGRCGKCHQDLDGNPLPAGRVNGLAEFIFDVRDMRYNTTMEALKEVSFIVLIMAIVGFTLFLLLKRKVIEPLDAITDAIGHLGEETFSVKRLPVPDTKEMGILVGQVRTMAATLEEKRIASQKALDEERRKMEQIRSFAVSQADHLGISDQSDLSFIIDRLSTAVKEVEKSEMLTLVCEFVTLEKKELILKNDLNLIRPAALYLTDLIAGTKGSVKKGAMELALEEAITNAMAHGNLEVESKLKEEDFGEFERLMRERAAIAPYHLRYVRIHYSYDGARATFTIGDEGKGFDWRHYLTKEVSADLVPHGRGIIIIRTFASAVSYNEPGTEVTLTFDL